MNVAIVDDDIIFSRTLKKLIESFLNKIFNDLKIELINDNFYNRIKDKPYDLIFLDIDLKKSNGINIGKNTLLWENQPIIIFVSARNELVFSSLSVRPFYFVRKSNLKNDLTTMFVLLKKYFNEQMSFFTFEFHGRITNIYFKDICIIESKGHNIIIKTKKGEYICRASMKNILETLGEKNIVQIQKAYAVNIYYIKEINKGIVYLKNNEQYNIGRKFKKTVVQKYKERFLKW